MISSVAVPVRHSSYEGAVQIRDLGTLGAGTTTIVQNTLANTYTITVTDNTTRRIVLPLMPRGGEVEFVASITNNAGAAILELFETLPSGATAAVQTRTAAGVAQNFAGWAGCGANADATQDADFGVAAAGQLRVNNAAANGTYLLRLKKVREYVTAAVAADGWTLLTLRRMF